MSQGQGLGGTEQRGTRIHSKTKVSMRGLPDMPVPCKAKGLILTDALRTLLLDAKRRWDVKEAKPCPKR